MNEGEQGGRGPEAGTPSVLHHSLSPPVSHPPLYSASRGVRGRREGRQGRRGARGGAGKTKKCPPSPDNSEATSTPPPAAPAAAAATPSRPLCTGAARSECRLPSPPPAPPPRASPSSAPLQPPSRPGYPRSALPPRPADPFKPPGLAAAAPGGDAGRGWGRGDEAPSGAAAGRPVR